jgi:predicted transcriptional regulator
MVRYSLRILEQDGLIEPSPQGAIITDKVSDTIIKLKGILDSISSTAQNIKNSLD